MSDTEHVIKHVVMYTYPKCSALKVSAVQFFGESVTIHQSKRLNTEEYRCESLHSWLNWYLLTERGIISFTNFNAQFLYLLTICMLHYNPRHVSSINMPIFRRTNCIITASGVVTLCKRLYSMPDESRLCRVFSHPAYCTVLYREWRHQMLW